MVGGRMQLVEQGSLLTKDLHEAAVALKKARKKFDQSNKDVTAHRTALSSALGDTPQLERLQVKARAAEERFAGARQTFRLQEEALKNLQSKLYSQELPRIMSRLQQQEVQRSREALSYILGLIELERRCAVMNENYANDMALKLKNINLVEDERRFTRAFMAWPIPPPPIESRLPLSHTVATEIPRTLSMPPAYESQCSGQASVPLRHATGSAVLGVLGEHVRHQTIEGPSQPPMGQSVPVIV
jgi:hypothetical protein